MNNDTQQPDIFVASYLHRADTIWHCASKAAQLKILSFFSHPKHTDKAYVSPEMCAAWKLFAHIAGANQLPSMALEEVCTQLEDSAVLHSGGSSFYMVNCLAIAYAASLNTLTERQMQVLITRILDHGYYDFLLGAHTGLSYIEYILARVARASTQS